MSRIKNLPKIVAVVGPTASGKTSLANSLANNFSGELISADSRQIYIGMNIGTAKNMNVPQHLINIKEPTEIFNVAQFKKMAIQSIKEIIEKNKLPILVGGTGLYINALLYNFNFAQEKGEKLFNALIIGLAIERKELVRRIEKRIDEQIKEGLVEEVSGLVKKYGDNAYALKNTIAYQELLPHIRGEITLEEAIEEIKKDTRRYAKRQMTWFRPNKDINWITDKKEAEELVNQFLN